MPPATYDTPFDLHAPQPTPPPFLPPAVASAAREFARDPHTPTLLALMADLVRRRLHVLDSLTSGGPGAGVFVRDGATLMQVRAGQRRAYGLRSASTSVRCVQNFEAAVATSRRDCRREAVLPVTCLLTSGEAAFLQEWLAWHMAQVRGAVGAAGDAAGPCEARPSLSSRAGRTCLRWWTCRSGTRAGVTRSPR